MARGLQAVRQAEEVQVRPRAKDERASPMARGLRAARQARCEVRGARCKMQGARCKVRGARLTMDPQLTRVRSCDDAPVGVDGCIAASSSPNLSRFIISRGSVSSVLPIAQSATLDTAGHAPPPGREAPPETRLPRRDGVAAGATHQADTKSVDRMDLRTASVPARRILSSAAWKGAKSDGATWLREQCAASHPDF